MIFNDSSPAPDRHKGSIVCLIVRSINHRGGRTPSLLSRLLLSSHARIIINIATDIAGGL